MLNTSKKLFWGIFLIAAACGSGDGESSHGAAAAKGQAMAPDGMAVFRQRCVTCHGADGTLGLNGAKDLSKSTLTAPERINIITNGKNLMTPFGAILSPEEIQAAAAYTTTLKK